MDSALHLPGGHIQAIHLALDTAADSLESLLVIAALHYHILAAVGQHLPSAALVPDAGHKPLAQPLPVLLSEFPDTPCLARMAAISPELIFILANSFSIISTSASGGRRGLPGGPIALVGIVLLIAPFLSSDIF